MTNGWQEVRLESVLSALIDYRGKSPPKSATGTPVISAKVVKNGRILSPIEQTIDPSFYPQWMTRGYPRPGDIVMTTEGPLGEVAQLDEETASFAIAQRVVVLRGIPDVLDNTFLKYLLIAPTQQGTLASFATGTTVEGISQKSLRSIPIPLPPLPEQRAIAAVLGALDDKIDANRRMNATLEAMAHALFKSWFVDFEAVRAKIEGRPLAMSPDLAELFSDQLVESPLGPIPEGWEVKPLQDVVDVSIGRTPPRKEQHHFTTAATDWKWLSIRDMGREGVHILETEERLTPESVVQYSVPIIPAGSIVVSFKLTVGRVAIVPEAMCSNEAIAHLKFKSGEPAFPAFLYFWMKGFDYSQLGSTSSIATAVNSQSIKGVPVAAPPKKLLSAFEEVAGSVLARILTNSQQSRTLAQLRELLLPKLLSGALRVQDAEKLTGDFI